MNSLQTYLINNFQFDDKVINIINIGDLFKDDLLYDSNGKQVIIDLYDKDLGDQTVKTDITQQITNIEFNGDQDKESKGAIVETNADTIFSKLSIAINKEKPKIDAIYNKLTKNYKVDFSNDDKKTIITNIVNFDDYNKFKLDENVLGAYEELDVNELIKQLKEKEELKPYFNQQENNDEQKEKKKMQNDIQQTNEKQLTQQSLQNNGIQVTNEEQMNNIEPYQQNEINNINELVSNVLENGIQVIDNFDTTQLLTVNLEENEQYKNNTINYINFLIAELFEHKKTIEQYEAKVYIYEEKIKKLEEENKKLHETITTQNTSIVTIHNKIVEEEEKAHIYNKYLKSLATQQFQKDSFLQNYVRQQWEAKKDKYKLTITAKSLPSHTMESTRKVQLEEDIKNKFLGMVSCSKALTAKISNLQSSSSHE